MNHDERPIAFSIRSQSVLVSGGLERERLDVGCMFGLDFDNFAFGSSQKSNSLTNKQALSTHQFYSSEPNYNDKMEYRQKFRRCQSLNAIVVPEKLEQMEKRKQKLSRRFIRRRNFSAPPRSSPSSTPFLPTSSPPSEERTLRNTGSKRNRQRSRVSRWNSEGDARDRAFGCGTALRKPSTTLKPRKGRVVRPNRGPPRLPMKQASIDRSP